MFTILITLLFIFIGQFAALCMWHTNNKNNALTSWKHPAVLIVTFCLNWAAFFMELFIYFSYKRQNEQAI